MPSDQPDHSPLGGSFSASHVVETPEQTNLEFTVAGVGSRFLALLIDSLIQAGVLILAAIVAAIFAATGVLDRVPQTRAWLVAGLIIAAFLLFYGYFILFEIFWNGQTPGKRTIGLRVIKDTGRRLSPVEVIGRNLLRIIDQMPAFYAVGILVALLNRQNKRLGDFVAGSLVVKEASLDEIKRSLQHTTSANSSLNNAAAVPRAPLGAVRLSEDELILIESFLQRRHELEPGVRSRMAAEILRRVESKLTVGSEEEAGIEGVLEAAVLERRAN